MPKTSIEWCDYSWPVVNGCRRASPGCEGCYAERLAATRLRHTERYRGLAVMRNHGPQWTGLTRLIERELEMPLRLRKPSRIFVADMGDLFYDGVPDADIDRVWAVMLLAPHHTFQVLTKRPDRMRAYLSAPDLYDRVLAAAEPIRRSKLGRRRRLSQIGISNPSTFRASWIWLGTSIEDQLRADERLPDLIQCPAAVRFVSCEPALGPIDLGAWLSYCEALAKHGILRREGGAHAKCERHCGLSWVIVGGESGPRARPFDVDWARSIIRQCAAARVPCFVKQLGTNVRTRNDDNFTIEEDPPDPEFPGWPGHLEAENRIESNPNGYREEHQGAPVRVRLRDRKGGDMNEWRSDLRVREFPPEVRSA